MPDFTEAQVRDHQLVRALVSASLGQDAAAAAQLLAQTTPMEALTALIMSVRMLKECAVELAVHHDADPSDYWTALCAKWAQSDMEVLGEGDPTE